jgi:tRNA-specific 2-thiouridylase
MSKKRVVVGFSGGKDSTAAIILLKVQNYEVHALTMRLGLEGEEERLEKIECLTKILNVPFKTIDVRKVFKEKVIDYFVNAYAHSLTPNPCVVCNKKIKFNLLMKEALQKEGADFYATGHYARKIQINGDFFLAEPEERDKSQIYFLSMIGNQALKHVLFPLSAVPLAAVWEMVKGLPLAHQEESQDVCFLHDQNLMEFLKEHLPLHYFQEGDIVDINGDQIGRHKGTVYFTIGQRRGTRFSSDRKLYVVKKDVETNTITLGGEKDLYSHSVTVIKPVFWRKVKVEEVLKTKFRYMSPFYEAAVSKVSPHFIKAAFIKPAKSVTPGQIGVFYDNDIIVAAGFIK